MDRLLAIWQGIHANDDDSVAWWSGLEHEEATFVEPTPLTETPTTPLAPFRKAVDQSGNTTWWTSNDVRDHTKLGYDYPQTMVARQTGDYAGSLLQWANQELGYVAGGNADPSQASKPDINHFEGQISETVEAFPATISIDGTTPLASEDLVISSQAASTSQPATTSRDISTMEEPTSTSHQSSGPVAAVKDAAHKAKALLARVTKRSTPQPQQTLQQRLGNLDSLVKDGKMTQWNASFAVDK